jgi:putative FmdB family regulatory protein
MPVYDYRCEVCEHPFETRHGFNDPPPACPTCGASTVKRLILKAPSVAQGMLANAGDGRSASKEELQSKWAEETPKLRKKLVDKLGEDTVNKYAPTLNNRYD